MTVLVRTATKPRPVYHLLGSDTSHTIKLLRPSAYPGIRASLFPLTEFIPTYEDPDYLVSMHDDLEQAYTSIAKFGRMDLEEDINVYLSHDASMDVLFPPGEFVRIDGGFEELTRLKNRDRNIVVPL